MSLKIQEKVFRFGLLLVAVILFGPLHAAGHGGAPSAPAVLKNAIFWLDASDPSTLAVDANGKVTTWTSKTADRRVATWSVAKPVYDTTTWGIPTVDFGKAGSGRNMTYSRVTGIRTIFCVVKIAKQGAIHLLCDSVHHNFHRNSDPNRVGGYAHPAYSKINAVWDGLRSVHPCFDVPSANAFRVICATTSEASNSDCLANDRNRRKSNGGKQYSELIVFDTVLSDADRTAVTDYLIAKWGVLAVTPVSVRDAISKERVVQRIYPYTEVNDEAMNRIIASDRAIDAAWVEAAKDPAAFKARQEKVRQAWIDSLGGFPARCDLDVKVTGVVARDGYRIEKTLFQSRPGHHVTADVFVPTDPRFKPPYPAVAVSCGHAADGKMWIDYQRPGVIGAKLGFVVMVCDPIDQGERTQNRALISCHGHNRTGHRAELVGWNTAQFRIWDGIRALDALCARPDVDRTKLAVTGHSGGGTASSYVMAMDRRVIAAAPSGFIASVRGTNWDIGASDAEQQFYGQLTFGMNHLALFMLAADRCAALHLATHADFFPYISAYETAQNAAQAFKSLGRGDCFQLINAPGPHLWAESSKQAEFLWFREHMKGEDVWKTYDRVAFYKHNFGFTYDDPKIDVGLARDQRNLVTPTGCVLDLPGERTVYDIIRDEARKLEAARRPVDPETVRRVAGIRRSGFRAEVCDRDDQELVNGRSSAVTLLMDDGIALQMYVFSPKAPKAGRCPVMIVSDALKSAVYAARVEELLKEGRAAVILEARGWGVTGRYFRQHGQRCYYDIPTMDEMVTMKYYHLGESMVGHRAEDILAGADAAKTLLGCGGAFDLEAYGRASIPAAHARFLGEGRFASLTLKRPTWSWKQMIDDETRFTRFADVVHGAYRHYDWTDLVGTQEQR